MKCFALGHMAHMFLFNCLESSKYLSLCYESGNVLGSAIGAVKKMGIASVYKIAIQVYVSSVKLAVSKYAFVFVLCLLLIFKCRLKTHITPG